MFQTINTPFAVSANSTWWRKKANFHQGDSPIKELKQSVMDTEIQGHEDNKDINVQHKERGMGGKKKIMDTDGIERSEDTIIKLKTALKHHMAQSGYSQREIDIMCQAMQARKMIFKECRDIRDQVIEDLKKHSPGFVFRTNDPKQQWIQEVHLHKVLCKHYRSCFIRTFAD
jgi:hypothetical protein